MRRLLLVVALASLVVVAGCVGDPATTEDPAADDAPGETAPPPDGELAIHHIDVGQADATLLRAPNGETMLIDTGGWRDDGGTVLSYLDERGIDRIDHLVATHAHADHIGGHAAVIETYETEREGIGAVYDSGLAHTSQTYANYLDAVETHGVDLFEVREGDSIPFGDAVEVTVLNPPEDPGTDLHAAGVVLAVEFGETRYLTTGDAETEVEQRLLDRWDEALDADLYHAGHHGSSTSSSAPFLDAVDPETALVSSALDSQYGHPHDEILERFADRGMDVYWTAVHGDVVFRSDGERFTVTTGADGPTDPLELLELKHGGEAPRVPVDRRPLPTTP
jgi:competence protein ComEC